MLDWLTDNKIPLGRWISGFVDFLNENAAWLKKNPGVLDGWLKDVHTTDGGNGLKAVRKSLGL